MQRLCDIDVVFSGDEFGTGYFSPGRRTRQTIQYPTLKYTQALKVGGHLPGIGAQI